MRIGIDLDNTICRTNEQIEKYEKMYLRKKKLDRELLWNDDILKRDFLTNNLEDIYNSASIKSGVKGALKYLQKKNHEIFIVTSRNDKYLKKIRTFTLKYLNRNNIYVDGIFFDSYDKLRVCQKENIDVLIDDNDIIYTKLNYNGVKCILFDDKNNYPDIKNKLTDWSNINRFL